MNNELHAQLKDSQARVRHEAIVKLARLKDEDALPLLNEISKNDPEPSLRKLAERAIHHILNEFSSTMSRVKLQEATAQSTVPPFSSSESERYIQRAYDAYEKQSHANALQYLIKALDTTPALVSDFDVQVLAENLTGMDGAEAAKLLTDRDKRKRFFDDDSSSSSSGNFPISPSIIIIFGLFLVVMSQFYLSDGIALLNQTLDEIEILAFKQSVRQINGQDFYVVAPSFVPATNQYPLLVALPDGKEDSTAMLRHFSEFADLYGVILLIPDFQDYRFSQIPYRTITLQAMIDAVGADYRLDTDGILLFGFGDGSLVATDYANRYTALTAGVITSGGTFLYPPPENVNYTIMYGAEDSLLHDVTATDVPFADLSQWQTPLNYLTIEHIEHEINSQQIDITRQRILDIYR